MTTMTPIDYSYDFFRPILILLVSASALAGDKHVSVTGIGDTEKQAKIAAIQEAQCL